MTHTNLILASSSPRRRELLQLLGVAFTVRALHVDESPLPGELPAPYAQRLADAKARAARAAAGDVPVLGADTVVACGGAVFGKPADRKEALAMLARLSGVAHWVYTAVALHAAAQQYRALSASRVVFREISQSEACAYWETGEPADKAGGYAIQGRGAAFVRRIEGSHSGIVGLPLVETLELLQAAGLVVPDARPEARCGA